MRSSNPVFNSLTNTRRAETQNLGADFPYGQYPPQTAERPITVDDVITKTGITLGVIVAFAIVNFFIGTVAPGAAVLLTIVGAIGGLIAVIVSMIGKMFNSAAVTLIYAVFEGLFVGGISFVFSGWIVGSADAGLLIGQAVIGTLGVFLGMLFVYKTGAIKVTSKFNRILTGALFGVVILSIGNLLLYLFTGMSPLRDGGMMAIIFSLVCIGLAAFCFLSDFDLADTLVRSGAPASSAWGVALGLSVTLVWLYTEILRLLSYFRGN